MNERFKSAEVAQIIEQLENNYNPELIMIFGSYAKGDIHPDSDLDLLIVKDTTARSVWRRVEARKCFDTDLPVDIIVYNPQEFSDLKKRSLFLQAILKESKIVYKKREYQI